MVTPSAALPHDDAPVRLQGVHKRYGAVHAVAGVDLAVARGEVFGLIGHNGAGKSTLFRIMLGLVSADAGTVRVAGCEVGGRGWRAARQHLGYLPEHLALYDNLSGLETLRFFARLKGAERSQCAALLEQVGLAEAASRAVRGYSKGMRQRLGLAQALLGAPRVLFLDEPTNGLDPQAIRDFYATLARLRSGGVTVLITSHILAELQQRVDRLAIMANGSVVAMGSVHELRERLELPVTLLLRGSAEVLQEARRSAALVIRGAGAEPAAAAAPAEAGTLALRVPRALKLPLLAALAPLAQRLQDLQVVEPSLEDLYFGIHK